MMRLDPISRTVTLLVALLLAPGFVFANAGKILFARGDVSITSAAGQSRVAEQGDPLDEGDRIATGERSMAQLRLSDGALISLRAHSDYQIVSQKDEGDLLEQAGKLFSGWMRTVTGAIGESNPDKVSFETPVATIGIRGTTFQVIHIPSGGLPGLEGTAAGTYIYLQDGGIETTAGGAARFLEAGEVVFIPLDGGPPVPAPDKKPLFSLMDSETVDDNEGRLGSLLRGDRDDGGSGREDLESTDALNDSVDDIFDSAAAFPDPGSVSHYFDTDGVPQEISALSEQVELVDGEYALVAVQGENSQGTPIELVANEGAVPGQRGSVTLGSGENRINWGVWAEPDYTVVTGPTKGTPDPGKTWHYMIGTNTIDTYADLQSLGLTGEFTYSYAGGTALQNPFGGSLTIDPSSAISVNFGASPTMSVNLFVSNGSIYTTSGAPVSDFYTLNGITLSGGTGGGSMNGKIVGTNADGVITNVTINDSGTYQGTAAFEKSGTGGLMPN